MRKGGGGGSPYKGWKGKKRGAFLFLRGGGKRKRKENIVLAGGGAPSFFRAPSPSSRRRKRAVSSSAGGGKKEGVSIVSTSWKKGATKNILYLNWAEYATSLYSQGIAAFLDTRRGKSIIDLIVEEEGRYNPWRGEKKERDHPYVPFDVGSNFIRLNAHPDRVYRKGGNADGRCLEKGSARRTGEKKKGRGGGDLRTRSRRS